ncbi:MAG: 50S ribosomal protein L32 [Chloroflexi bacterium]|nr:50S ribosomal protein L32 [Chloroflexota bacterium]MCL5947448.1 50S ribosomal protein L32 [Chloroflexota bacterium]
MTVTGVPKKRVSQRHQGERRSQIRLKLPSLVTCPNCHRLRLQHHVCPSCGYYRGRKVIETAAERRRSQR